MLRVGPVRLTVGLTDGEEVSEGFEGAAIYASGWTSNGLTATLAVVVCLSIPLAFPQPSPEPWPRTDAREPAIAGAGQRLGHALRRGSGSARLPS